MDELHKYIINLMQDQFGVRWVFMPALKLLLVTHLLYRTTSYSMFSNMANNMIERITQSHGDLDCGYFIIDSLGTRWVGELGSGDYLFTGYVPFVYVVHLSFVIAA